MKDLMIILCVLLVILTLISILGGSIRYNEDPSPKVIQPEPPKPSQGNKEQFATTSVSDKLKDILTKKEGFGQNKEKKNEGNQMQQKSNEVIESFQGYEYAMF